MAQRLTEPLEQFPLWPVYRAADGSEHPTLRDAARHLGRVSMCPSYVWRRWAVHDWRVSDAEAAAMARGSGTPRTTILKEVVAVCPGPGARALAAMSWRPPTAPSPLAKTAAAGILALEAHLNASFRRDREYVMLHSGGYDSRMLSLVLRRLRPDPKRMLFVTWEPEVQAARAILRTSGWPLERWRGISLRRPADYYAPILLDFAAFGRRFSDPSRFCIGPAWLDTIPEVSGRYGMGALWSDPTMKFVVRKGMSVAHFVANFTLENPSPFAARTREWLDPFASVGWMAALCKHGLGGTHMDLKREIIRQLDSRLLKIPNPRFALNAAVKAGKTLPCLALSPPARQQVASRVRTSWLARHDPHLAHLADGPAPTALSPYNPWLLGYMRAAIVQALVEDGVEVLP